jgi:hypothetical protein
MIELIALNDWKGDVLTFEYEDLSIKYLEDKAVRLHAIVDALPQYHLETTMIINEKTGHVLNVVIRQNGEHKCKENTHQQKTDI